MWLSDLFARGYEDSLSARAERAFRESLGIAADSSLEAAGYRFKEGRFTLTENVLIDTSGILLLWNEYELAAYVFGQQRIKLGFETITDLIPAHGVFARVAASRPAKR